MSEPPHHLPFELAPGQIQYVNNFRIAHCRTEYEDAAGAEEKRHLVRIFLRDTGETLGGLPVLANDQTDARLIGAELSIEADVSDAVTLSLTGETVDG